MTIAVALMESGKAFRTNFTEFQLNAGLSHDWGISRITDYKKEFLPHLTKGVKHSHLET